MNNRASNIEDSSRTALIDRAQSYNFALFIGILVFFGSVVWINFHCAQWYKYDYYADAYLAKLMSEEKTLFPPNWTFGNQYYVFATPVVAAVFYKIVHNTITAMAMASCFMTLMVYLSFLYAAKSFKVSKTASLVGLFLISGACIVGTSASSDLSGFPMFYTAISYYSCYAITFFLTIGTFLRLRENSKCTVMLIITVLLNFAIGMQSIRGFAVICFPLFITAMADVFLNKRKDGKTVLYSVAILIVDLSGFILCKNLNINAVPNKGEIAFTDSFLYDFLDTIGDISSLMGLDYLKGSIKWWPVAMVGIMNLLLILSAVFLMIKIRDYSSNLSVCIFFLFISIGTVFGIGTLFFSTAKRYFFPIYLLTSVSAVYILEAFSEKK